MVNWLTIMSAREVLLRKTQVLGASATPDWYCTLSAEAALRRVLYAGAGNVAFTCQMESISQPGSPAVRQVVVAFVEVESKILVQLAQTTHLAEPHHFNLQSSACYTDCKNNVAFALRFSMASSGVDVRDTSCRKGFENFRGRMRRDVHRVDVRTKRSNF